MLSFTPTYKLFISSKYCSFEKLPSLVSWVIYVLRTWRYLHSLVLVHIFKRYLCYIKSIFRFVSYMYAKTL